LLETDEDYGKKRNPPRVAVCSPDERALVGAVVEVWPAGKAHSGASPLRSAKTEPSPSHVEFRGLPAGDYLVVAGLADCLKGAASVQELDPTAKKPTDVTVTVRDGARIHGHADVPGLYAGDYRVAGRVTGEMGGRRFVRMDRGEGKPAEEMEVRLREAERVDLDMLVLPAASLSGSLACSDEGSLPARASFRVFPFDVAATGRTARFGLETDQYEERAFLRGLPERKFKLSVVVKHPYLVPPSRSLPEQEFDLVRGKLITLPAAFDKVGGLLEVHSAGAAARLVQAAGAPTIRPVVDGQAHFPGTPPGNYRAEACEDAACARVVTTWEGVEVAPARTIIVGEPR
jgi:hypothetical protein